MNGEVLYFLTSLDEDVSLLYQHKKLCSVITSSLVFGIRNSISAISGVPQLRICSSSFRGDRFREKEPNACFFFSNSRSLKCPLHIVPYTH